jgi:hypothetical protein
MLCSRQLLAHHHITETNIVLFDRNSSDSYQQAQLDRWKGSSHVRGHGGGSANPLGSLGQIAYGHIVYTHLAKYISITIAILSR